MGWRTVAAWLLPVLLVLGLAIGPAAAVAVPPEPYAAQSGGAADRPGDTPGDTWAALPACDPVTGCTGLVVPPGTATAVAADHVSIPRPDGLRSQIRFAGPPVSLPPPRS